MRARKYGLTLILSALLTTGIAAQEKPRDPQPGYELEGRPGFVLVADPDKEPFKPLNIAGIPSGLQSKVLSESPSMGAVSMLTYVPVGWHHDDMGYHNVDEEMFLLEGDLSITDEKGKQVLTKYSYTFIPAGMAHGPVTSEHGAVLVHWFKGKPDFVRSKSHKSGARLHAQVRDRHHFSEPWYIGDPFPKYRYGGNFPGAVHKLLRHDPDTGENTWTTFGISAGARSGGSGNFGGGYESHPSFEEYYFPEKSSESVIGECLENGPTPMKYGNRSYWWRPGGVGHGGPLSHGEAGYGISLVRTGTQLWADYYTDCSYQTQLVFTGTGWKTQPAEKKKQTK